MRASLLLVPSLLLGCSEQLLTNVKDADEPGITVTPASLTFDGAGSQVVTLSSVGDAPLVVSSVGMRSAGAFVLTDAGGLPGSLDPEARVELVITWEPGAENTGWLDIVSNDPDTPLVPVALDGTGGDTTDDTGPDDTGSDDTGVAVASATLDPLDAAFEAVVGDTVNATFTLTNTGAADLVIGATVTGAGFALTSSVPATLSVGGSLALDVAFTPAVEGLVAGSLDVTLADLPTLSAPLAGIGLPDTSADPTSFTWTGVAQTYTVPAGVYSLTVEAWGAGGGAGSYSGAYAGAGGGGGYATTTVAVTPGDVYTVRPGEGGHTPGGGAGASLVWDDAGTLLLVAAGGGGGATDGGSLLSGSGAGGAGGGDVGGTGATQYDGYWGSAAGGAGGTTSAGGAGGVAALGAASGPACTGGAGGSLVGGGGASGSSSCGTGTAANQDSAGTGSSNGAGGGGGAGYYGGGGGGSVYTYFGGGGGGGSSWTAAGTVESGVGATPGGTGSAMWDSAAGAGGVAGSWPSTPSTDGAHGLVVFE